MTIRKKQCLSGIVALGLLLSLGCGKKHPVKHRVKTNHIKAIDSSMLTKANEEKKAWAEAKAKYEDEKEKLKLREYDMRLGKQWHRIAKLRAKRMKLALELKNRKVPVKVEPGAYAAAREDLKLAEKNLEYRKLLYKFHRDMVKLQKRRVYTMQAQYMEAVVEALHKANHASAKNYRKFRFSKQSANLKLKMAAVQEKVERAQKRIKTLKKQVEPHWGPGIKKRQPQHQQQQPEQGDQQTEETKAESEAESGE